MENKEKTFKETLEALSAKELILLMVDSVENPVTKLDMSTYGEVTNGICYGCAATNTILKLSRGKLAPEIICRRSLADSASSLGVSYQTLVIFEGAINFLRCGYIGDYEAWRLKLIPMPPEEGLRLPEIKQYGIPLPVIENYYTKEDLDAYRKLAELQEK